MKQFVFLRTLCVPISLWLVTAPAFAPVRPDEADAAKTIQVIAQSLKRFGEETLANRLVADYKAKKVSFTETDPATLASVEGTGDASTNKLKFLANWENGHRTIDPAHPYRLPRGQDKAFDLVQMSLTVVHEYVHMDQTKPQGSPKFEDPAWRRTEEALINWTSLVIGDVSTALDLPAGSARKDALRDLADTLRSLRSAARVMAIDVAKAEKPPTWSEADSWKTWLFGHTVVTPGQTWSVVNVADLCERQLRVIQDADPDAVPAKLLSALVIPPGGAWVQTRVGVWTDNPGLATYIAEAAAGPAQVRQVVSPGLTRVFSVNPFQAGSPRDAMQITWQVPGMVAKGESLAVVATGTDVGSTGDPRGSFVSLQPSMWSSLDRKNWTGDHLNLETLTQTAKGNKQSKTWSLAMPAPANGKLAILRMATGSGFWRKYVDYWYEWRDK